MSEQAVFPELQRALLEAARKPLLYFSDRRMRAERTRNWFMFGSPDWKFLVKPNGQPDEVLKWQRIPPEP